MSFHIKINSFLAEWISLINAFIAIGFPLLMGLWGGIVGDNVVGGGVIGFIGGFIVGSAVGALGSAGVCGVLAILIDIRNQLKSMQLGNGGGSSPRGS